MAWSALNARLSTFLTEYEGFGIVAVFIFEKNTIHKDDKSDKIPYSNKLWYVKGYIRKFIIMFY